VTRRKRGGGRPHDGLLAPTRAPASTIAMALRPLLSLPDPPALMPTSKALSARLGMRVTFRDVSAALLLAVQVLLYDRREEGQETAGIPLSTALLKKGRPRTAAAIRPLVFNLFVLVAFLELQSLAPPRRASAATLRRYRIANELLAYFYEIGECAAAWLDQQRGDRGPMRAEAHRSARPPTRR
jgi:hypothetical protein